MRVSDQSSRGRCASVTRYSCGEALLIGRYCPLLQKYADGNTVTAPLGLQHELSHLADDSLTISLLLDDRIVPFLLYIIHARPTTVRILANEPVFRMQIVIRRARLQHVQIGQPRMADRLPNELGQM